MTHKPITRISFCVVRLSHQIEKKNGFEKGCKNQIAKQPAIPYIHSTVLLQT